jgi:hypothetical protein
MTFTLLTGVVGGLSSHYFLLNGMYLPYPAFLWHTWSLHSLSWVPAYAIRVISLLLWPSPHSPHVYSAGLFLSPPSHLSLSPYHHSHCVVCSLNQLEKLASDEDAYKVRA